MQDFLATPARAVFTQLCWHSVQARNGVGHLVFVETESRTVCVSDSALNGLWSACEAVHLLSDKTQLWSGQNFSDGQIIM